MFLTNFDKRELGIYQEAIKKSGASVFINTIAFWADGHRDDSLYSLHCSKDTDLRKFWDTLKQVKERHYSHYTNTRRTITETKDDSKNGIEHKCPCCGYEVEWDWDRTNGFVKGDESFIKIHSPDNKTTAFCTDKPRHVDYGLPATENVILLGCPKCGTVSFKIV